MANRKVAGFAIPKGKLRDLRSLAILKRKLTSGMSDKLVGQEFGISSDTVRRSMRKAMNDDMIKRFEDEMLKDVVPEAMACARQAMKEGNATVALEILKGTGILKKQRDSNQVAQQEEGDELEIYIRRKRDASHIADLKQEAMTIDTHARRADRPSPLPPSHPPTFPHSGDEPYEADPSDQGDEAELQQADGFRSVSGESSLGAQRSLAYQEGHLLDEDDGA